LAASGVDHGLTMDRPRICKISAVFSLCAAWAVAHGGTSLETFVIHAGGREATITIPIGAVSAFSASNAEAVANGEDPRVEIMRLSGDVLIDVRGANQAIRIKADRVLLELTADDPPKAARARAEAIRRSSSMAVASDNDTQTFLGNVVFTVPTASGAMRIAADRIDDTAGRASGILDPGA
jgi:hypothetical protein